MTGAPTDRCAFILEQTRLQPVPHTPEIRLFLAEEALPLWQKTEAELDVIGLPPPFWAFAWAGGQGLARYILDHPAMVRGLHVLDFASGSGLVAIAAAKAGARTVTACDIDALACAAIGLNAAANTVTLDVAPGDLVGQDAGWDVVLAGDIAYERATAARVFAWLGALRRRGARVLVGDPGRAYLPHDGLAVLASYLIAVSPDLEDGSMKRTQVFSLRDLA